MGRPRYAIPTTVLVARIKAPVMQKLRDELNRHRKDKKKPYYGEVGVFVEAAIESYISDLVATRMAGAGQTRADIAAEEAKRVDRAREARRARLAKIHGALEAYLAGEC